MLVDGEPRPKRHVVRRGGARQRGRAGARGGARRAAGARSRSPTRTSTCWWSTSRPAWSSIPARASGPGRSCRRSRAAWRAATTPTGPASCTGWTATRPACSCSRARRQAHATLQAALQRREIVREYLALVEGRPAARRGTIDAPLGRDRRVRTRMSTDTDDPREAVTHFEVERNLPSAHAPARAARDGPHAPDPRAPGGDRAPRRRRPGVRPPAPVRARAAVPARRAAGVRPPRTGERLDLRSPLPDDLGRRSSGPPSPDPRESADSGSRRGRAAPKDRPTGQEGEPNPPEVGEGGAGSQQLQRGATAELAPAEGPWSVLGHPRLRGFGRSNCGWVGWRWIGRGAQVESVCGP